ncbi:hypothetical protein M752DRAFT_287840 [Aspergillus phoenicis ATCC 13157]|uniref:Uncharacterized protein n=1 Tax=Aspergillus phoenicis ATCC 13157 TaxID=1353007 RepID=A0A370P3I9_ASPPH|nr:hypothetical protein M752DRAFT_287840 [Aspergillus phoenicis ATCC 13157]
MWHLVLVSLQMRAKEVFAGCCSGEAQLAIHYEDEARSSVQAITYQKGLSTAISHRTGWFVMPTPNAAAPEEIVRQRRRQAHRSMADYVVRNPVHRGWTGTDLPLTISGSAVVPGRSGKKGIGKASGSPAATDCYFLAILLVSISPLGTWVHCSVNVSCFCAQHPVWNHVPRGRGVSLGAANIGGCAHAIMAQDYTSYAQVKALLMTDIACPDSRPTRTVPRVTGGPSLTDTPPIDSPVEPRFWTVGFVVSSLHRVSHVQWRARPAKISLPGAAKRSRPSEENPPQPPERTPGLNFEFRKSAVYLAPFIGALSLLGRLVRADHEGVCPPSGLNPACWSPKLLRGSLAGQRCILRAYPLMRPVASKKYIVKRQASGFIVAIPHRHPNQTGAWMTGDIHGTGMKPIDPGVKPEWTAALEWPRREVDGGRRKREGRESGCGQKSRTASGRDNQSR